MARDSRFFYWWAGLLASWAILLERKPRRAELALYVLPRAVDSLFQILRDHKLLASVPHGETLLFAGSMATLMYFYERRGVAGPGARQHETRDNRALVAAQQGSDQEETPRRSAAATATSLPSTSESVSDASGIAAGAHAVPLAAESEDAMPQFLRAILARFIQTEHAPSSKSSAGKPPARGSTESIHLSERRQRVSRVDGAAASATATSVSCGGAEP